MYDFCIELGDHPGNLALIGNTLGAAGVNIIGLCLNKCAGRDVIHFLVEDCGAPRQALEDSGITISRVSEVFVLSKDKKRITGKPGSFGGICSVLADNGIKVNFAYPAENNLFVFGVNDILRTRELLG